jgi:tetratricopeptide (TPR) repeat protein
MGFRDDVKPTSAVDARAAFQSAFVCLAQGRFAEAFAAFSKLSSEQSAAAHFNLALCYTRIADFQKAANEFEKALSYVKSFQSPQNDSLYNAFRILQIKDESFLKPMDFDFPQTFPNEAKEDIVMALILSYKKCGLKEKARALANSLAGERFNEFKKGINGDI